MKRRTSNFEPQIFQQSRWMKWILLFVFWTFFGLFFASQFLIHQAYAELPITWTRTLPVWLIFAYCWAVLTPLIFYLARRFPIERRRLLNLLVHALASLILSFFQLVVYLAAAALTESISFLKPPPKVFQNFAVETIHFNILTYWAIIGISQMIHYYRKYREREMRAAQLELSESKLKTQLAEAELDALKMQLHPHFLFNTLNNIVVRVRKNDNVVAVDMLTGLSELLRHSLENIGAQKVSLKHEIEFLKNYLEIEQIRFKDRLRVEFKVEPGTLRAAVPNLILQPLIENAIRHGIGKRMDAGLVSIEARRVGAELKIRVRDDGIGLPKDWSMDEQKGIGIGNTRARLRQLYGDGQTFDIRNEESGGVEVILTLPFETHNNQTVES